MKWEAKDFRIGDEIVDVQGDVSKITKVIAVNKLVKSTVTKLKDGEIAGGILQVGSPITLPFSWIVKINRANRGHHLTTIFK